MPTPSMNSKILPLSPAIVNGKEGIGGSGGKGEEAPPTYTYDDLGNAQRFKDMYGWAIRYNHTDESWYLFDGTRYAQCARHQERELMKNISTAIELECAAVKDSEQQKILLKHAKHSRSVNAIRNALWLCQTDPSMAITADDLDRNPMVITIANGTIDLSAYPFQLKEPDHRDLITKRSPVPFIPDATCHTWLAFLETTFSGDTEIITFLQRSLGYALTGLTDQQCFWLLHGTGRNGKSTFLDTISWILGDYATTTRFESLTYSKASAGSAATPDLARLRGARFVTATEGQENARFDEALIKSLTGGEEITVRYLHANFFSYRPEYKIWLATNHLPRIVGNDLGIWRRVLRIPFQVIIDPSNVDRHLSQKLRAEASGILNWMIAGWRMMLNQGFAIPTSITEATAEYKLLMDRLGEFITDSLVVHEAARITNRTLFQSYEAWCKENNEPAWTQKHFSRQFEDRGHETKSWGRKKIGDERGWEGVGLKSVYGEFAQPF